MIDLICGRTVKRNPNALALLIGVEKVYENANADALFADKDPHKIFRDYAIEKIGIPENEMKTLINDKTIIMLLTLKNWLEGSKINKVMFMYFCGGHFFR